MCQASVLFGDPGNSTVNLIGPDGQEHTLNYFGQTLHSTDPQDDVQVQFLEGKYYVSINDSQFFSLDEIVVTRVD